MKTIINKIKKIKTLAMMAMMLTCFAAFQNQMVAQITTTYSGVFPIVMENIAQTHTNPIAAGWAVAGGSAAGAESRSNCVTASLANMNSGRSITYRLPHVGSVTVLIDVGTNGRGIVISNNKGIILEDSCLVRPSSGGNCHTKTFDFNYDGSEGPIDITITSPSSTGGCFTNVGTIYPARITITNHPDMGTGDDGKTLHTFIVNDIDASVDQTTGDITALLPYGTDLENVNVTFTTSPLATVTANGSTVTSPYVQNFTSPVTYIVTAAGGGESTEYEATLTTEEFYIPVYITTNSPNTLRAFGTDDGDSIYITAANGNTNALAGCGANYRIETTAFKVRLGSTAARKLVVRGATDGNVRSINTVKTSNALDGDYTDVVGANIGVMMLNGQVATAGSQNDCFTWTIADLDLPQGTFVEVVLNGRIRFAGVDIYPAEEIDEPEPETTHPLAGKVIITQVYGGGATNTSSTWRQKYVELFNTTNEDISLAGLFLNYGAGSNAIGALATNPLALSGTIKARSFFLVQTNSHATNGVAVLPTTPDQISATPQMAQAAGRLALSNQSNDTIHQENALWHSKPSIIDFVMYGTQGGASWLTTANAVSATSNTTLANRIFENGEFKWTASSLAGNFEVITAGTHPLPRNSDTTYPAPEPSSDPILTVSPTSLTFGEVEIETESATQPVVILAANLTNLDYSLTGDDVSDFEVTGTLNETGGTLQVAFSPETIGEKTATLHITSEELNETVALTGTGIEPIERKRYKLVTNVSQLEAGAKYLIVGQSGGVTRAMSRHNTTNNRHTEPVTLVSDTITTAIGTTTDAALPFEITLGGADGAWTLYDEVLDGFLRASSNSSNNLQTGATANWTISFPGLGDSIAITCITGGFSRNTIRYNSGNNPPLMSAYASGVNPVYLYKEISPLPKLDELLIADFTHNSVDLMCGIVDEGASTVTEFGFQYATNSTFTDGLVTINSNELDDNDPELFSTTITGLTPDTEYWFRAFATNDDGTGYSNVEKLTTEIDQTLPYITLDKHELTFAATEKGTTSTETQIVEVEADNLTELINYKTYLEPSQFVISSDFMDDNGYVFGELIIGFEPTETGEIIDTLYVFSEADGVVEKVILKGTAFELYTVSFDVGNGTTPISPIKQTLLGETLTLPNAVPCAASAANGWEFAGWSETGVNVETQTVPTFVTSPFTPTEDIMLYAVYRQSTGDFRLPAVLTDELVAGEYIFGAVNGTPGANNQIGAINATIASNWQKYTFVTPTNGQITTSQGDDHVWILTPSGTGFTMQNKATSQYLFLGTGTGGGSTAMQDDPFTMFTSVLNAGLSTFKIHPSATSTNELANNQAANMGYRMYTSGDHATGATGIARAIRFYALSAVYTYATSPNCILTHTIGFAVTSDIAYG
ncbi:MAG: lamin tail domain-containing protein, partial [Bacteroidales bacterium]|nr:lamin tail domain-containing protein [Bacteroidales bacterium]